MRVREWLSEHSGHLLLGVEGLGPTDFRFEFYPSLGFLRLTLSQRGLLLQAETTAVGPGYHVWLCKLVRAMGIDLRLRWQDAECCDDTGFWWHNDELVVERAMQDFACDELGEVDPLAARSRFPWWERGHPAGYYLNRAEVVMQRAMGGGSRSAPEGRDITGDIPENLLEHTHEMLLMARSLDPQLPMPWVQWLRILDGLGLRGTIRLEVESQVVRLS